MSQKKVNIKSEKALIQRYLIWCYKTTKENLDRIDRKFTQAQVDRFILHKLEDAFSKPSQESIKAVKDFEKYILEKEEDGQKQKFSDADKKILKAEYIYLIKRLDAIEAAICHFLGTRMLSKISQLYEEEMTRRILESREH